MAKYVIEDTTLTGIADAIRGKTGSADPIAVTDMATQISAITGGGSGVTLTTVLEEQTVEGFADTGSGVAQTMMNTTSSIVVGETYKVLWDGAEITLIAEDLDGIPALPHEEGGFCVQYLPPELMGTEGGAFVFISLDTEATSHTVGIYQVTGASSGGSAEGIVYVTFMNGGVELCKTACMAGDSTVDPVEDGKIAVPTKEPSVSTVYTYADGWSLTDGGAADVTALVDVSEDRTVYAVYNESAREYTVNFYDDDGTTLLESLQVVYGQVPSPAEPEKTGYYFDGWTPELTAVTADADYVAVWDESNILLSGSCGDAAYYELDKDYTLTISGTGAMTDYSSDSAVPWYSEYNQAIKSIVISEGITRIGNYAFYGLTSALCDTIPNSVTSIGNYAFMMQGANRSHDVIIPDSVTSIGAGAFNSCTYLKNVTIGSGVTSIGFEAFEYCAYMETATFKDTTTWKAGTTTLSSSSLANTSTAATYLTSTYKSYEWTKT